MKKTIYLDYAATTPVDPKVLQAMLLYLRKEFGNPSSVHQLGQRAKAAIEEARQNIAEFLNCSANEIVFTGSATESDNLAILGIIKKFQNQPDFVPHIITSQFEHHAVLVPLEREAEKEGVEATYLLPNKEGIVESEEVDKAIKKNTVLVSMMYVNNEIGTIQPIQEIGKLLKSKNEERKNKIYFHSDAVQAVNYLDCDVQKLGVDFLTLSSHKIYGPKGIGCLYCRQGVVIDPLILGGGQEAGMRSGTENVAGIVGFGEAIKEAKKRRTEVNNILAKRLRDRLIKGVLKIIPDSRLNGSWISRLPNNANFSFNGVEGEAVVMALDQKGICASTGSACSSRSLEPSHVLLALGLTEEEAHGSTRFSLGRYTTKEEIDKVLKVLPPIIERLRQFSGYSIKISSEAGEFSNFVGELSSKTRKFKK